MHEQLSESADDREDGTNPTERDTSHIAEGLFHRGPIAEQLEQQIGLLTQAMTDSMFLACGAFPDLAEGELPDVPPGVPAQRPMKFAAARSLQLHDAARLSFATASLVGALTKLKSQPGQRFTTRQTWIPDSDEAKKPRKITTFTHTLIAPRDVAQFEPAKEAATTNATPTDAMQ